MNGLPKLTQVAIALNPHAAVQFRGLAALGQLQLSNRVIWGPPCPIEVRGLPGLVSLESLNLDRIALGDARFSEIGQLPKLATLNLSDDWLRDNQLAALGSIPAVTELTLVGADISDASVRMFANRATLAKLDITSTIIGDKAFADLKRARPLLDISWRTSRLASLEEFDRQIGAVRAGKTTGATRSSRVLAY